MKRINALLHDVTIINFKFVCKLFLRYRKVSAAGIILAFSVIGYLFFSQSPMYQKQIYFKIYNQFDSESQDSKSQIPSFHENSSTILKMPEIVALVSTYDFKTTMAGKLAKYDGVDFESPLNQNKSAVEKVKECGINN